MGINRSLPNSFSLHPFSIGASAMPAHSEDTELARINLSQCVDQLAAILAKVRAQEPYVCGHGDPYFDQTFLLSHSHIDGAIRSLRGIVAHLNDIKSA
jgi:hypothetical protein